MSLKLIVFKKYKLLIFADDIFSGIPYISRVFFSFYHLYFLVNIKLMCLVLLLAHGVLTLSLSFFKIFIEINIDRN